MRFQVKVGHEFESEVVITLEVDQKPKPQTTYRKVVAVAAGVVVVGTVIASALYGAATGDYSTLRAIAETGRDALSAAAGMLTKSK